MEITFITGYKDRDCDRVKRSLDSLCQQSVKDFKMIFIDYGSSPQYSKRIKKLIEEYNFCEYFYSETRGWIWNRGSALNSGAKIAKTKYLFFTDIDIVYDKYFVEETLRRMTENRYLIPNIVRIPKYFNEWEQLLHRKRINSFKPMKGWGIICLPKLVFDQTGGFDEQYGYWSNEDYELAQRINRCGIEMIPATNLLCYHQWHNKTSINIPYSLLFHNVGHYYRSLTDNTLCVNQNRNWGKIISYEDRPIFKYIDPDRNLIISKKNLVFRDAYDMDGLHYWAKEIENMPNILWAIPRNPQNGVFTTLVNKVLHQINWRLDHFVTYLDDFAQGLIFYAPGLIKDYYINCSIGNKQLYSIYLT